MSPTINVEFEVIGSTLASLFDAAAAQMIAFLAGSGQQYDWRLLDMYVDGQMIETSAPGNGWSSLPGKYTAHCVYRAAR